MTDRDFWKLIDEAQSPSAKFSAERLADTLSKRPTSDIVDFECLLRTFLRTADTSNLVNACRVIEGSVTDDSFLYFRCWLVSLGENVYRRALDDPDSLANHISADQFPAEESLLYVATHGYSIATGREEDYSSDFPRAVADSQGLAYDVPCQDSGDIPDLNDLANRFPALWKTVESW